MHLQASQAVSSLTSKSSDSHGLTHGIICVLKRQTINAAFSRHGDQKKEGKIMQDINKYTATGNVTQQPELRSTNTGKQVLQFNIAVNDRRRNPQTNEWEDYPSFIGCVVFGKQAEVIYPRLAIGTKVVIDGKLRWSQWERDGQKRSKIEVLCDTVLVVASPKTEGAISTQNEMANEDIEF